MYNKKLAQEGRTEDFDRNRPIIKRSLFIVGLLLRFFDFTNREVLGNLDVSTTTVEISYPLGTGKLYRFHTEKPCCGKSGLGICSDRPR